VEEVLVGGQFQKKSGRKAPQSKNQKESGGKAPQSKGLPGA